MAFGIRPGTITVTYLKEGLNRRHSGTEDRTGNHYWLKFMTIWHADSNGQPGQRRCRRSSSVGNV